MVISSKYLVKINERGLLTIEMPQMIGKYLVIEQQEERLTITPLDVTRETLESIIARRGKHWTMLGGQSREVPQS